MTERLPNPGSDNNTWGGILNAFLGVFHNADGTPKLDTDDTLAAGLDTTAPSSGAVKAYVGAHGGSGGSSDVIEATDVAYGLSTGGTAAANTTALNAAIAAAASAKKPLHIPAGTYNFNGPIVLDPWIGCTIYGDGMDNTILTIASASGLDGIQVTPSASGIYGLHLHDFSILGNANSGAGLNFTTTSNLLSHPTIERVEVSHCGTHGIVFSSTIDALVCINVYSLYNTTHQILFDSANYISQADFLGCATGRGVTGLYCSGQVETLTWLGGECSYSEIGMRFDGVLGGTTVAEAVIIGAVFEGNTTYQAKLNSGDFTLIGIGIKDQGVNLAEHLYCGWRSGRIDGVRASALAANSVVVSLWSGVTNAVVSNVDKTTGAYVLKDTDGTKHDIGNGTWSLKPTIAKGGIGVGNSAAADATTGTVAAKMQVFGNDGVTSLGYVPIYDTIGGNVMAGEFAALDLKVTGLTGSANPARFVGATTTGAPTTGAHLVGDYVVTQDGHIFVCTTAATPGTFTDVGVAAAGGPDGVTIDAGGDDGTLRVIPGAFVANPMTLPINFTSQAVAPSPPSAGDASIFARTRAGRESPVAMPSSGAIRSLAQLPYDKSFVEYLPLSTNTIRTLGSGAVIATTGTITTIAALATCGPLINIASAASANVQASMASGATNGLVFFRGAATDVFAGFWAHSRCKFPDASYNSAGAGTGSRLWPLVFYYSGSNLYGGDRGGTQDIAGFVRAHVNGGATDTNWQFVTNDNGAVPTVGDTGMAFTVAQVYDFYIWCPAGSATIYWQIDNLTAATTAVGTSVADLPRVAQALAVSSGLLTVDAVARTFQSGRLYVESDIG